MRVLRVMCVGAAVLALGACDRNGEGDGADAAGDSSSPAANAPARRPAEATTAEAAKAMVPKVKPGKWMISTTLPGGATAPAYAACITEEKANEGVWDPKQNGAGCQEFRARREGDAVVMRGVCTSPEGKMTMESRLSGDFQTSYTVETSMKQEPAPPGGGEIRMTMKATYAGPC
jgi:hypothetical protein